MLFETLRQGKLYFIKARRWTWKTKAVWLRATLCLLLAIGALFLDQNSQFDFRFQIRPQQEIAPDIIILNISLEEWESFHGRSLNWLRTLKEDSNVRDSNFWNVDAWESILTQLLKSQPKAIGVGFFFPPPRKLSKQTLPPQLLDSKVVWAAKFDSEQKPILPRTATSYGYNVGALGLPKDPDGVYRRFIQPTSEIPHFILRLSQIANINQPVQYHILPGKTHLINYRGRRETFPTLSLTDLYSGKFEKQIKNKIVIIGSSDSSTQWMMTPLGEMPQAEVLANLVDDFQSNRWIQAPSKIWLIIGLATLLIFLIWILFSYPQSVALVFLFWIGIGTTAFSLWFFDSFHIWIPILPNLVMIGFTYILFLGYQLTQKENANWLLHQEQKNLLEVEQLKTNFVSLISHDLKTPIAKIQAICDRIVGLELNTEAKEGVISLRKESSELHRYIQSILKITRIESRDFRINKDVCDINEIISNVLDQIKPLAIEKNIQLIPKLEPMFSIEIDALLIHEVILNLVENGIKYCPAGSTIEIESQEMDNWVFFSVQDNGDGISNEDQQKIFRKFYRGKDQELKSKGTGIGLYLVKYFIELHGGSVFLESNPGNGTRIGFRLPIIEESSVRHGAPAY